MSKQTFFVQGTSCKSCEILIEREISALPGVHAVDVSHKKGRVVIDADDDASIRADQLTKLLNGHGYVFSSREAKAVRPIPWQRIGAMLILIASVYIIFDKLGLLHVTPAASAPAGFVSVFVIGLIASVSSCTAVVGGLVAASASASASLQRNMSQTQRMMPHVLFNLGRVGGFFVLGALVGWIGTALQLNAWWNGAFVIAVAILMIVIGVGMLDVFDVPMLTMPKWASRKIYDIAESKDRLAPMLLGAMTFFLPCGFTQSMQLYALTLQDPLRSGLVMAVFAVGTMPVLLGIGGVASSVRGKSLKMFTQSAGVVVTVLGLSNIFNGATLMGLNVNTAFAQPDSSAPVAEIINGVQYISMDVTERGVYDPDLLVVKKDVPVEWTVVGADFLGCANTLLLPAFGVSESIHTGKNVIRFTPTKEGSFTFSCSMGMVRGTMVVTNE